MAVIKNKILDGLGKINLIHEEFRKENKKKKGTMERNLKSQIDHLKMISSQTFEKINKFFKIKIFFKFHHLKKGFKNLWTMLAVLRYL